MWKKKKKKEKEEELFLEGDVSSCWAAHRGVVERHQIWEDLTVHYRLYIQHTHDGWPAGGSKIKFNSLGGNRCCLLKNICMLHFFFFLKKITFQLVIQKKEIQPVPFYKSLKRFSRPSVRPFLTYKKEFRRENKRNKSNPALIFDYIHLAWRGIWRAGV